MAARNGRRLPILLLGCLIAAACTVGGVPLEGDAAVWMTSDGENWSRVIEADLGGPGAQQMTGITSFDGGLVAVGSSALHDQDYDGRIWVSGNGTDWEVVTDPDLGGPDNQFINAVAAAGPGLIALGHSDDGGDLDVVVWTSTDGVRWERVGSSGLENRGDQVTWPLGDPVMVMGESMIISGMDGDDAAIWASSDGLTWSRVDTPDALSGGGEHMISELADATSGVVAVGWSDLDAVAWASADGTVWTRVDSASLASPGVQRITGVVETETGLVAVGDSLSYEEIYFLGRGSRETSDAAVWTSTDGGAWQRIEGLEELGDQHMYNVGALGSTLVAVGIDSPDPRTGGLFEAGPSSGRDVDGAVWTSNDGRSWTRVRSGAFGGPNWQDIFDLAELHGTLFVVGGDDTEGSSAG
ncbi:MAG TPA: hypothetical protein VF115_05300 [Acidimicrobiia bacterium]